MDLDLSQEHELVRATVREFANERVAPVAEELDRESRFPYEIVAERQELRASAAPAETLEENRVAIARLQQRLSEALIEKYLIPAA